MADKLSPTSRTPRTHIAGEDLSSASIHSMLKLDSTANQVKLCTAATDRPYATLWTQGASGEQVEVIPLVDGDMREVVAHGALSTVGGLLSCAAAGRVDDAADTKDDWIIGQLMETASAQDDVVVMAVLTSKEPG